MRLLTAHRILIASFIVFSLFFAFVEWRAWRRTRAAGNAVGAALSLAAAGGFGLYYRTLRGKTL